MSLTSRLQEHIQGTPDTKSGLIHTNTCTPLTSTHTHTHSHRRVLEGEMMRRSIISCQQWLIEYENNILTILVRLTLKHTLTHSHAHN